MKENLLDVLLYLFENTLDEDTDFEPDRERLLAELEDAGFHRADIHRAFDWLEGLANADPARGLKKHSRHSMRVFNQKELFRLSTEARGFLHYLEQIGVLDQENREVAIDRIMALDTDEIDIDEVKWIILMVLFNQPGQEQAYARMEDLVFEEGVDALH
ncbi:MAG TPA: DUF494 domain-containing protein [Gammaproteobacteria bacterium]|nr:DUF494 domain-containing protein [Gammaproteobacteria bacterium]